jgi:hypothetical protein
MRRKFAAKREKGQASLLSFGVGKVGNDGRVPIPESHSKKEREQGEDGALLLEEPEETKRRPGRPVTDKTATHPEATEQMSRRGRHRPQGQPVSLPRQ